MKLTHHDLKTYITIIKLIAKCLTNIFLLQKNKIVPFDKILLIFDTIIKS